MNKRNCDECSQPVQLSKHEWVKPFVIIFGADDKATVVCIGCASFIGWLHPGEYVGPEALRLGSDQKLLPSVNKRGE